MTVKMDHALRHLVRWCKTRAGRPGVREALGALEWMAAGLLCGAGGLRGYPIPLALALCLNLPAGKGLWAALGGGLGSRLFWGGDGIWGVWWSFLGGLASSFHPEGKTRPVLAAIIVSCVGIGMGLGQGPDPPMGIFLLQTATASAAAALLSRRDRVRNWGFLGLAGMALAGLPPGVYLGAAGAAALAVGSTFPAAAALALGLDTARESHMSLTAVITAAWLGKTVAPRRLYPLLPVLAGAAAMTASGDWKIGVLPPLLAGGYLGLLLPFPAAAAGKGATGYIQVRLELTAGVMARLRRQLLTLPAAAIDREALLQRLRSRTCGCCPLRESCLEQARLTVTVLEDHHKFVCRRPGLLAPELARTREKLRLMKADRRRREEYRLAMAGQYLFFTEYMRKLADRLAAGNQRGKSRFGVKVGIRSRGKERCSGDWVAAFPGGEGQFFVLLCDGMGTGPGAREEGRRTAAMLRKLLKAEVPPEHAVRSVNTMLVLEGRPAAVTVDLVELRLDTGQARLYKWGAAPSWWVRQGRAEKIGTAIPPPGFAIGREWTAGLSLKRGETLILISDGVDGEDIPRRVYMAPDAPPGELAERLLEGKPGQQPDDAAAAVIRLYPGNLASS